MEEIWKPVPDGPGYEASNLGNVRSVDRLIKCSGPIKGTYYSLRLGINLRPAPAPSGHLSVAISGKSRCVHELVLKAFVGMPPKSTEGRHRDGDEANNRLTNLEWATRTRNSQDKKWHKGSINYKLSPGDVYFIRIARKHRTVSHPEIRRLFGVCNTTIGNIVRGEIHTDVLVP